LKREHLEGFVFRSADEWVWLAIVSELENPIARRSMRRRGYDILAIAKMFGPAFTARVRTLLAGAPVWAVPIETRKKELPPVKIERELDVRVKAGQRELALKILVALDIEPKGTDSWLLQANLSGTFTRRRILRLLSLMGCI
jgi:hypothetical protein